MAIYTTLIRSRRRTGTAPPGPPPFDPLTDVGFTHAWWAEGPRFAAVAPTSGANVPTWPDEIGAQDATQPEGTARPRYNASDPLLGKPALAATTTATTLPTMFAQTIPFTLAVVAAGLAANKLPIWTSAGSWAFMHTAGGKWAVYNGAMLEGGTGDAGRHLFVFVANGASSRIVVDGTTVATGDAGATALADGGLLGGYVGGYASPGQSLAFVGIAPGVMADADLADLAAWAHAHYGTPAAPPEPPPFSPADLTGLRVWLDASTLTQPNGGLVNPWPDQSGLGLSPTVGAGHEPTCETNALNGKRVVRIAGIAPEVQFLAWPVHPNAGAPAGTVFALCKSENDPGTGGALALMPFWGTHSDNDHYPFVDGTVYTGWGSTVRKTCGDPPGSLATWRTHTIVSAPNDWRLILDGAPVHAETTNAVAWASFATLVGSGGWNGRLAELILYNRALPTAELNAVGGYLAGKWAVPWTPVA